MKSTEITHKIINEEQIKIKIMKLEDLKTWDELQDYLLERMDYATSDTSKSNSSFTKEQVWNSLIGDCMKWSGQDLPIRTKSILLKRVKRDFGMKI